ncbi:MAG: flavin reductase family protein [Vicinamibacteria bacterium]
MDSVDPRFFLEAMSRFASGVTVVTAHHGGERVGLTASSFVSVSKDPPLVLVCVANTLLAREAIEKSGAFAVNILGVHQLEAGLRFAGLKPEPSDRFEGLSWDTGVTGSPLLEGSLASLDCRLHAAHEGGDHTIFVGEVLDARLADTGEALVYHSRVWHRPEPLPKARAVDDDPTGI